jgi:hypothetical protein
MGLFGCPFSSLSQATVHEIVSLPQNKGSVCFRGAWLGSSSLLVRVTSEQCCMLLTSSLAHCSSSWAPPSLLLARGHSFVPRRPRSHLGSTSGPVPHRRSHSILLFLRPFVVLLPLVLLLPMGTPPPTGGPSLGFQELADLEAGSLRSSPMEPNEGSAATPSSCQYRHPSQAHGLLPSGNEQERVALFVLIF